MSARIIYFIIDIHYRSKVWYQDVPNYNDLGFDSKLFNAGVVCINEM